MRRRFGGPRDAVLPDKNEDEEKISATLKENGHAALYIDAKLLPTTPYNEGQLQDHFKHFRPTKV